MTAGGEGVYGYKHTEETKQIISTKNKAHWQCPERVAEAAHKTRDHLAKLSPEEFAKRISPLEEYKQAPRILTAFDKTQPLMEWAKELDLNPNTIRVRLFRGHSVENALSKKPLSKTLLRNKI